MGKGRSSNDQRSDAMNPNNHEYWDSRDHHADQLNPNSDEYHDMLDNRANQKNPNHSASKGKK